MSFLNDLPCRKVPGIGKVQEKILSSLGIHTMGELLQDLHKAYFVSKPATRCFLLRAALGMSIEEGQSGKRIKPPDDAITRKSLGVSRTFDPISSRKDLESKLLEICELVSKDCITEGVKGQVVTLKVRTSSYDNLSKCMTSAKYIQSVEEIYPLALSLLETLLPLKARLLGVTISKFKNAFALRDSNQAAITEFISPSKFAKTVGKSHSVDTADVIEVTSEGEENIIPSSSSSSSCTELAYACPICGCTIPDKSAVFINRHIDACLAKRASPPNNKSVGAGKGAILKYFQPKLA
jgi:DNA polymerase kappa